MSDTRHKTVIEVAVDDRQIVGLSRTLERAFDDRSLDRFEKALDRIAAKMEGLGKAGGAGAALGGGLSPAGRGGAREGGALAQEMRLLREELKRSNEMSRRAGGGGGGSRGTSSNTIAGGMFKFHMLQQLMGMGPGMLGGSATASALGSIPYIGGTLGAAAQTSVRLYNEYAQQQMAQAGVFGGTGVGPGMDALVRQGVGAFGLAPGAVPGMVAQFGGTSGLTGDRLSGAFGTQLALSQLLGVNNAGSMIGAAEMSGGRVDDPAALMQEAVGAGLLAGIRESRLDQHMQQMASFTEDARTRGIPLAPGSVMALFTAFRGSGASFAGEAGSRFAGNFGQGMASAGRGRGFAQGLALRAAGFGSGASYQESLERLEARDPETMRAFVESLRGMAGDSDTGAYLMRSAMEGLGVDMSAVQSRELFENGMVVDGAEGARARTAETLRGRRATAGGIFGAGAFSGGMALQRQAIGSTQAESAQAIQNLDLRIMGAGLQALSPVISALVGALDRLTTAFTEGGFSRLATEALAIALEPLGLQTDTSGNQMTTGDVLVRAGNVAQWALNTGAAEVLEAVGAEGLARRSREAAEQATEYEARREQDRSALPGLAPALAGPITPGALVPVPTGDEVSSNLRIAAEATNRAADEIDRRGNFQVGDITIE